MEFPLWKESFHKLSLEHNLCYEWSLQVCILFIVMTSKGTQACWGWWGADDDSYKDAVFMNMTKLNATLPVPDMDEKFVVNLTGISDPLQRIIKSAWGGWEPDEETQMKWKIWYDNYMACKEKYEGSDGKRKKKKKKNKVEPTEPTNCTQFGFGGGGGPGGSWGGPGSGGPGGPGGAEGGGSDYSEDDHRGPGSGWPDSPGWKGLGVGSHGAAIPPWAYVPINVGKPSLCYLSPTRGICLETLTRWGYNPYTDQCEKYIYSGCGGTRNRFTTKEICEKHCMQPIEPSCSSDSGIMEKFVKLPEK